jgi:hypothetical protein
MDCQVWVVSGSRTTVHKGALPAFEKRGCLGASAEAAEANGGRIPLIERHCIPHNVQKRRGILTESYSRHAETGMHSSMNGVRRPTPAPCAGAGLGRILDAAPESLPAASWETHTAAFTHCAAYATTNTFICRRAMLHCLTTSWPRGNHSPAGLGTFRSAASA